MFKQALSFFLMLSMFAFSAFTPAESPEKWTATLTLEGINQPIVLTSSAIYGGYNSVDKKYFLFGKDHMFSHATNAEFTKIFSDLCTYNGSGKISFEINQVLKELPGNKPTIYNGNISFKKKFPIQGTFSGSKADNGISKNISCSGDLKNLGFVLTPEAQKVFSGKFQLVFTSSR